MSQLYDILDDSVNDMLQFVDDFERNHPVTRDVDLDSTQKAWATVTHFPFTEKLHFRLIG